MEMGAGEAGLRLITENEKVHSYCLSPTLPPLPFLMITFHGPTNEDVPQARSVVTSRGRGGFSKGEKMKVKDT